MEVERAVVDREGDVAEHVELEAGSGDDDVGIDVAAVGELESGLGERGDLAGDDGRLAAVDRLEQVAVGHECDPLAPRQVARRERFLDEVVVLRREPRSARPASSSARVTSGSLKQRSVNTDDSNSIRRRTISCVHSSGVSTSRNASASSFTLRPDR